MRLRIQDPEAVSKSVSDLKRFLAKNNLNQSDFAKLAGVSRQYVSMIMKGHRPPSQKLLDIIESTGDEHALSV